AAEIDDARRVAVVSKTFADRYFGDEDPIGRPFRLSGLATLVDAPVANPAFQIVGVIASVRNQGVQEPPLPEVFIPYTTTGAFERGLLVRTTGSPQALVESVRREIWAVDRRVAVTMAGALTDYLTRFSYAQPRFSVVVLGVFAGI